MDETAVQVALVKLEAAVSALTESVSLKLDRLGDRIDTGDNRTMQALLMTDERLTTLAGRHSELATRVEQSFESFGKRMDQQRDAVDSLNISRSRLYGLAGGIAFAAGGAAGFVTHLIK